MPVKFNNPAAFEPFYDEEVAIEGSVREDGVERSVKGVFKACVLDCGLADIDSDAVASSDERVYSVQIKKADWNEVKPPCRGMTIRRQSHGLDAIWLRAVLKVLSVEEDGMNFILRAESKGASNG